MVLPVSDRGSNKNELIDHAAEILGRSKQRLAVFTEIYRGKRRVKTVEALMKVTNLRRNRVLDLGRELGSNDLVTQTKVDSQTAYDKIDFFQQHRDSILRLVKNPGERQALPTKRRPQSANQQRQPLKVKLSLRLPARSVRAKRISIDEIDSFHAVRKVGTPNTYVRIPEKKFKKGIAAILGEKGCPKDWGGELSDLFSGRLVISGNRHTVAIAFKGPGVVGRLTSWENG